MAETGMVERAAKAHYERLHYTQWENLTPSTRAGFLAAMRAAIEAMREPTEEMKAAKDDIDMSAGTDGIWRAMIDAALTPKE